MRYIKIRIPGKLIKIPYLEIEGETPGKTCVISGGMHGDEVNGVALIQEFLKYAEEENIEKSLHGKIIVLPILNISGFKARKRQVTYDGKDLNRSFNKKGKTASNRIANALSKHFFGKADLAIDCHDSGTRSMLIPHARIHATDKTHCRKCTHEMARAFGSKIIIERRGTRGMLAVEMEKLYKLPILTVEIGGGLELAEKFLTQGAENIANILTYYKFLPGEAKIPIKQYYLKDRFGIAAKETGIIKFNKKLGQRVHIGNLVGTIYAPTKNKTIKLIAPMCGIIFSMQNISSVTKGEIMYSILEDKKKCHVKRRRTVSHFEEVVNIEM
ncbi:MAG: succinylglutamate desuccinylase/aspartoacylase family protein [Patescibacteria group bacterium]|nr:succinylglutamate desuccinylase/aspartoacylase family protein [Patescibacteria group bacterium]